MLFVRSAFDWSETLKEVVAVQWNWTQSVMKVQSSSPLRRIRCGKEQQQKMSSEIFFKWFETIWHKSHYICLHCIRLFNFTTLRRHDSITIASSYRKIGHGKSSWQEQKKKEREKYCLPIHIEHFLWCDWRIVAC